jgi:hypothetical protein
MRGMGSGCRRAGLWCSRGLVGSLRECHVSDCIFIWKSRRLMCDLPSIAATVSRVFFVRARRTSYSSISCSEISNATLFATPSSSSRVDAIMRRVCCFFDSETELRTSRTQTAKLEGNCFPNNSAPLRTIDYLLQLLTPTTYHFAR